MTFREYKLRENVVAKRVEKTGNVGTHSGLYYAHKGDYIILENGRTYLQKGSEFDKKYMECEGDTEFHPAGRKLDEVIAHMTEFPDDVERIKSEESKGGKRKGILGF